jgi:hypothetical protein
MSLEGGELEKKKRGRRGSRGEEERDFVLSFSIFAAVNIPKTTSFTGTLCIIQSYGYTPSKRRAFCFCGV